mmetsp:Transcript_9161/g.17494  ORF Transcript_9161/g.17494 Transcript_9161/m.17494 type:complete len:408 (+) Transcript_9161:25-1248(+)
MLYAAVLFAAVALVSGEELDIPSAELDIPSAELPTQSDDPPVATDATMETTTVNLDMFDVVKAQQQKRPQGYLGTLGLDRFNRGTLSPAHRPSLLNDKARTSKYRMAMMLRVTPETVVLDVGPTCGLLSMVAAGAGAKHVYTVCTDPAAYKAGVALIEKNKAHVGGRVTILNKPLAELKVGVDIAEPASLVVFEVTGAVFMEKGLLGNFSAASSLGLAKPDAKFIPEFGHLNFMAVDSFWLRRQGRVTGFVDGFDFSPLNSATRTQMPKTINARALSYKALSRTFLASKTDFYPGQREPNTAAQPPYHARLNITANADGILDGVLSWFDLYLVAERNLRISTNPELGARSSQYMTQLPPRPVKSGDVIELLTGIYEDFWLCDVLFINNEPPAAVAPSTYVAGADCSA